MIPVRQGCADRRSDAFDWRPWALAGLWMLPWHGSAAPLSAQVPASATVVQPFSVSDSLAPVAAILGSSSGWVAVQLASPSPSPGLSASPVPQGVPAAVAPQSVLLLGGATPGTGPGEAGNVPLPWLLEWQDRQGAGILRGGAMAVALQWEAPTPSDATPQGPAPYSVIVAFN